MKSLRVSFASFALFALKRAKACEKQRFKPLVFNKIRVIGNCWGGSSYFCKIIWMFSIGRYDYPFTEVYLKKAKAAGGACRYRRWFRVGRGLMSIGRLPSNSAGSVVDFLRKQLEDKRRRVTQTAYRQQVQIVAQNSDLPAFKSLLDVKA